MLYPRTEWRLINSSRSALSKKRQVHFAYVITVSFVFRGRYLIYLPTTPKIIVQIIQIMRDRGAHIRGDMIKNILLCSILDHRSRFQIKHNLTETPIQSLINRCQHLVGYRFSDPTERSVPAWQVSRCSASPAPSRRWKFSVHLCEFRV